MSLGKQKGFTLLEMLVVISVIGLLAAFVLVGLRMLRVKAVDIQRKADITGLGKMLTSSASENGEKIPIALFGEAIDVGNGVGKMLHDNGETVPKDPDGSPYWYWSDGECYLVSSQLKGSPGQYFTFSNDICTPDHFVINPPTPPRIVCELIGGCSDDGDDDDDKDDDNIVTVNDTNSPVFGSANDLAAYIMNPATGQVKLIWEPAYDDYGLVKYKVQYKAESESGWHEVPGYVNTNYTELSAMALDQRYAYKVIPCDFAGNCGNNFITNSYDAINSAGSKAPIFTATPTSSSTTDNKLDLTFMLHDPTGGGYTTLNSLIIQYRLAGSSDWSFCVDGWLSTDFPYSKSIMLPAGSYDIKIIPVNLSGMIGIPYDSTITIAGRTGDVISPMFYGNSGWLNITTVKNGSKYNLQWTRAGDNIGVVNYQVTIIDESNGTSILSNEQVTSNYINDVSGLLSGRIYTVYVSAFDAAGNVNELLSSGQFTIS